MCYDEERNPRKVQKKETKSKLRRTTFKQKRTETEERGRECSNTEHSNRKNRARQRRKGEERISQCSKPNKTTTEGKSRSENRKKPESLALLFEIATETVDQNRNEP